MVRVDHRADGDGQHGPEEHDAVEHDGEHASDEPVTVPLPVREEPVSS
jgi:hypothetical protein